MKYQDLLVRKFSKVQEGELSSFIHEIPAYLRFSSAESEGPPPSRASRMSEVFWYNGKPFKAAKGEPKEFSWHKTPLDIRVDFKQVNWSQTKSKVKKPKPVGPTESMPGNPRTRSWGREPPSKRMNSHAENDLSILMSPTKKQKTTPRSNYEEVYSPEQGSLTTERDMSVDMEDLVFEIDGLSREGQKLKLKLRGLAKELEIDEVIEVEEEYEFHDSGIGSSLAGSGGGSGNEGAVEVESSEIVSGSQGGLRSPKITLKLNFSRGK